jgi:hypothetical protein
MKFDIIRENGNDPKITLILEYGNNNSVLQELSLMVCKQVSNLLKREWSDRLLSDLKNIFMA